MECGGKNMGQKRERQMGQVIACQSVDECLYQLVLSCLFAFGPSREGDFHLSNTSINFFLQEFVCSTATSSLGDV